MLGGVLSSDVFTLSAECTRGFPHGWPPEERQVAPQTPLDHAGPPANTWQFFWAFAPKSAHIRGSMSEGRTVEGDTYEMLWDCKFCRTPKLLGLTHRYCPVCGAPQDAEARYFPSDEEKVLVKDHQYFGKDLVCEHCNTFNSRNSQHCRDCGAPLQSSPDAPVQNENSGARGLLASNGKPQQPLTSDAPRKRSRVAQFVWLALAALVATICVFSFGSETRPSKSWATTGSVRSISNDLGPCAKALGAISYRQWRMNSAGTARSAVMSRCGMAKPAACEKSIKAMALSAK